MARLLCFLLAVSAVTASVASVLAATQTKTVVAKVDFTSKGQPFAHPWKKVVGSGHMLLHRGSLHHDSRLHALGYLHISRPPPADPPPPPAAS